MKIKSKISVKGKVYSVHKEKGPIFANGHQVAGYCDYVKRKIVLDSNLKGRALAEVYLHEVGHAAMRELHLVQCLSHDSQEIIADGFADVFIDVLGLK